jgi:hypothetical protein
MLPGKVREIFENRRLRKIAGQVRDGIVPKGVEFDEVMRALQATKKRGAMETFGFLFAKVKSPDGNVVDHGLVGARAVTLSFAKILSDAFCDSAVAATLSNYNAHAMGQGSAAEGSGDEALGDEEDGRNVGSQTHGASSNVYKSVATITATSNYTVIEHGIFRSTDSSSTDLLDRTKVTEFTVNTDDEVEWTYELTIVTAG